MVGTWTGQPLGATLFRGAKPIDSVWATLDIEITGACMMPAGFEVGDHRLSIVDFTTASGVGSNPPSMHDPQLDVYILESLAVSRNIFITLKEILTYFLYWTGFTFTLHLYHTLSNFPC